MDGEGKEGKKKSRSLFVAREDKTSLRHGLDHMILN